MKFGQTNYPTETFSKYGQITPGEDHALTENERQELQKLIGISDDDFQNMQDSAKNQDTFNQSLHLPKGVFNPKSSELDPDKPTIVISFTEDLQADLKIVLDAIDKYFKLDIPAVKAITDRFNILVAWSTSCIDMIKTLKKSNKLLGDKFSQAKFLFLNDLDINNGSGQFYEKGNSHGDHISKLAKEIFSLGNNMRTLIQTGNSKRWSGNLVPRATSEWARFLNFKDATNDPLVTLTQDWQDPYSTNIPCSSKLSAGISENQDTPEKQLAAIHVPVQAFVKALEPV
jgi:hypothetical protein